jgi:hypothetical protein
MITRVRVTQAHIDRGCELHGADCPIFRAMRDAGIPVTWVFSICWSQRDEGPHTSWRNCHPLPSEAVQFIADFDSKRGREKAKPFEFEADDSKFLCTPLVAHPGEVRSVISDGENWYKG